MPIGSNGTVYTGKVHSGFGIASLILGCVAFIIAWVPFFGLFSLVFSVPGLLLGLVGLVKVLNERTVLQKNQQENAQSVSTVVMQPGLEFPATGLLVCFFAIVMSFLSSLGLVMVVKEVGELFWEHSTTPKSQASTVFNLQLLHQEFHIYDALANGNNAGNAGNDRNDGDFKNDANLNDVNKDPLSAGQDSVAELYWNVEVFNGDTATVSVGVQANFYDAQGLILYSTQMANKPIFAKSKALFEQRAQVHVSVANQVEELQVQIFR
jgi:hypothetical protein